MLLREKIINFKIIYFPEAIYFIWIYILLKSNKSILYGLNSPCLVTHINTRLNTIKIFNCSRFPFEISKMPPPPPPPVWSWSLQNRFFSLKIKIFYCGHHLSTICTFSEIFWCLKIKNSPCAVVKNFHTLN